MYKTRPIAVLFIVIALMLTMVGTVWAVPPLPSSFYGEIHITDGAPIVGDQVLAYVPGVTPSVGSATIGSFSDNLVYNLNVRGDDSDAVGKDGAYENDVISFYIGSRLVMTGVWHTGTNVQRHIHPPDPVVTNTGPVAEGSAVTVDASTSQDWGTDISTYAFDCDGDSTYEIGPQAGNTAQCTFDDGPSVHTVNVRIVDLQGGVGTDSTAVTVNNVAPTATLGNNGPVSEASPAAISFTGQFDPSTADTTAGFHYAFSCANGDLSGATYAGSATSDSTACTYDDNGIYTVKARILDKDNGFTEYSTNVTVDNVAPTVTLGNNGPVNEASPATISFTGQSDPSTADTTAGFHYAFSCTNGDLSGATYAGSATSASTTCTYDDNGVYTVKARILDKDNGFTEYSTNVTVDNVAPTATFNAPTSVNEGSNISLSLTDPLDPSSVDTAAGFQYAFDCGGGGGYGTWSGTSTATCATTDNGNLTVRGKIRDKDLGEREYTAVVTVNNVAPTADAGSDQTVNEGSLVNLNGAFTDPGAADTHTFLWHLVSSSNGQTIADAATQNMSFTPNDNGTYTFDFTVTDDDTEANTDTVVITANDVLPVAEAGGPYPGTAGQSVSLTGTPTCVVVDACTVEWFFGATLLGTSNSVNYTWNTIGDYTVEFRVTDNDGNMRSDTADVHITGAIHSFALVAGWNMVSFDLVPQNTAIADVLSSLSGNYNLVYAWNAQTQAWLLYDPNPLAPDALHDLDQRMGFWIHMTAADTLEVVGSIPSATDIDLYFAGSSGWNLVGYPASTEGPLPGALEDHGAPEAASLVYAFHADDVLDPWKLYDESAPVWASDLTALSRNWGYWVKVTGNHTWHVEY